MTQEELLDYYTAIAATETDNTVVSTEKLGSIILPILIKRKSKDIATSKLIAFCIMGMATINYEGPVEAIEEVIEQWKRTE
jgi:hypothetical protein